MISANELARAQLAPRGRPRELACAGVSGAVVCTSRAGGVWLDVFYDCFWRKFSGCRLREDSGFQIQVRCDHAGFLRLELGFNKNHK